MGGACGSRWENNIIMGRREIGLGYGLDSSDSGHGYGVRSCEHGNEPSDYIKLGDFLTKR
jgi:hypothetical protein